MDSLRNNRRPGTNRRPGVSGNGQPQGQGTGGRRRRGGGGGRGPQRPPQRPQGQHDGLPNHDDFEAELAALDALDAAPGQPVAAALAATAVDDEPPFGEGLDAEPRPAPVARGPEPRRSHRPEQQRREPRHDGRQHVHDGRQAAHDGRPNVSAPPPAPALEPVSGCLEIHQDGYGFLRDLKNIHGQAGGDVYVPGDLVRRYDLRPGLMLEGKARTMPGGGQPQQQYGYGNQRQQRGQQRGGQRPPPRAGGPRLHELTTIEGAPAEDWKPGAAFDRLTPVDPTKWLRLETVADRLTTRIIDMFTPIGMGQRGLIVASPRSGKTVLIQHMADAISHNWPDVHLIVLLVDERPEEVTDMRRSVKGEVYASSNDHETSSHVRLAELVIERSKRLAEQGKNVVVLLDSITRLARAYNKHVGTGRTMTGGLDVKALDTPKKLFGAARAFEEGGSLTIMATALVETGSRMDDVIFEEFKGTGNMEIKLDRKLADRRIYPAINLAASGTRKEERLIPAAMLERITLLRRSMLKLNDLDAMETLQKQLKKHETNNAFLQTLARFVT